MIRSLHEILRRMGLSAASALFAACAVGGQTDPTITIDGSSTVFPITDAVAVQFQKMNPVKVDVKIPVGISGTHGGFMKFCAGQIDIANASRPINREESALCAKNRIEYIEVPVAYDGLAVVVSTKNGWAHDITSAELKKVWEPDAERRITKWSQIRPGWPDRELRLYGPGYQSGTYDYFTQAIVGKEHASRSDFESSEDDEVLVQGVSRDELALGYFGYAYLHKHSDVLRPLAIDDGDSANGAGPVAPSALTVRDGTYQPLSRPIFIYVRAAALERREVKLFVGFYLSKARSFVTRVGYVPLIDSTYHQAHQRVIDRRTGSLFGGGSQVGVSIEQLLRLERSEGASRRSGESK